MHRLVLVAPERSALFELEREALGRRPCYYCAHRHSAVTRGDRYCSLTQGDQRRFVVRGTAGEQSSLPAPERRSLYRPLCRQLLRVGTRADRRAGPVQVAWPAVSPRTDP